MNRYFYRDDDVVNIGGGAVWFWLCGTTLLMKEDELCEEPKEMKDEGEGIISGKETKKVKEDLFC